MIKIFVKNRLGPCASKSEIDSFLIPFYNPAKVAVEVDLQNTIDLLKKVYEVISGAAEISGRDGHNVKLIAVSKKKPAEGILRFRRAGVVNFGENYVQEFIEKYEALKHEDINWHFIGHLQRNKVKYIVDKVFMIHTVGKVSLAREIQKQAEKHDLPFVNILIQVNIGEEPQKNGVMPSDLYELMNEVLKFDRIRVRGLMSIPPFLESEELRPYHRLLFELRRNVLEQTKADPNIFKELSMGMSNDFDVAIEEGSTMVRVGSMLFGARD